MKAPGPTSEFLERRSYRRRRLMDAVRLLPIVGLMLLMLPLFWPSVPDDGTTAIAMSTAVVYVFFVWLLLICAAFALWRVLWAVRRADLPNEGAAGDEDQP